MKTDDEHLAQAAQAYDEARREVEEATRTYGQLSQGSPSEDRLVAMNTASQVLTEKKAALAEAWEQLNEMQEQREG